MASFATHFSVGIFSSFLTLLPLTFIGFMSFSQMFFCFFIAIFGSLLPDVDIPASGVAKFLFFVISIFLTYFIVSFSLIYFSYDYNIYIVFIVVFFILLSSIPYIFSKITAHRGIVHSLPMVVVLTFAFSTFCNHYLSLSSFFSWMLGVSLGYGFFIHLLLDELYSIDISGLKFKKSFGSAIKFYDKKEPIYSFLIYVLIIYQIQFLPTLDFISNKFSIFF